MDSDTKKMATEESGKENRAYKASFRLRSWAAAIAFMSMFTSMYFSPAAAEDLDFKFDHVGISVPDIKAAITWYQDVLGFTFEREGTLSWVPAKVVHLRRGAMRVELFQVEGFTPLPIDRRFPNRDLITNAKWSGDATSRQIQSKTP